MEYIIIINIIIILIIINECNSSHPLDKACADFNYGSSQAALAGIEKIYVCPSDGIAYTTCSEKFHVKEVKDITESKLSIENITFMILVGSNSKYDAALWWLPLLSIYGNTNILLVADACNSNYNSNTNNIIYNIDNYKNESNSHSLLCDDSASKLYKHINDNIKGINIFLYRVSSSDTGYQFLSCKLREGARRLYEMFPSQMYYFKIDTDTVVFPKRLVNLLRTLDATSHPDAPIYFGTVVESGMNLLLCGREGVGKDHGNQAKGGLCYGQGGAGYGLNNKAMKALANSKACDPSHPVTDVYYEDTYVGKRMYDEFNISVIHCGGLCSSEIMTNIRSQSSVSFHYVDGKWLHQHGNNLLNHYNAQLSPGLPT